ncbi:MAG: 50S ribosomal protein L29 [Elusimicrobiota bacterium]
MKPSKMRELSDIELLEKIKSLREEFFNLKVQKQIGQLENPLKLGFLRKDIARALTIAKERGLKEEIGRAKQPPVFMKKEESKDNGNEK